MARFNELYAACVSPILENANGDTVEYHPENGPCSSVVGIFVLLEVTEVESDGVLNAVRRAQFSVQAGKLKPPFARSAKFKWNGATWNFDELGLYRQTGSYLVIPLYSESPLWTGTANYRRNLI